MKRPFIVGITGGIGSGKTTVSKILLDNGFYVYDSDSEARRIQNEDNNVIRMTCNLFGEDIYVNKELNRKKVASLVFGNPLLLKKLSDIVHPAVIDDFSRWINNHTDNDVVFFESAIMFEAGFEKFVDSVILITASETQRIKRVMARDNLTVEQVKLRILHQKNDTELNEKVDAIINTDDGPPEIVLLREVTEKILKKKGSCL